MVFSSYLYLIPYKCAWYLQNILKRNPKVVIYCSDPLDYIVLRPVLKHLPPFPIVTNKQNTLDFLKKRGIEGKRMPSFPLAVIMCRHATHKFPEKRIIKIGLRHGAYHFKAFSRARYYNAFDVYLVTSMAEVDHAVEKGITTTRAVGFPKLDPVLDGTIGEPVLKSIREKAAVDSEKRTILFTATWDGSGMSAVARWAEYLHLLTDRFNILVTVHPWTSAQYISMVKETADVHFIDDPDVLPYLMIADVMVADTSSIIAEFCALDKPIITFSTPETNRTELEITKLLASITMQIDTFDELPAAIQHCLDNPHEKRDERREANRRMFDKLDGQAGKRAADEILRVLEPL